MGSAHPSYQLRPEQGAVVLMFHENPITEIGFQHVDLDQLHAELNSKTTPLILNVRDTQVLPPSILGFILRRSTENQQVLIVAVYDENIRRLCGSLQVPVIVFETESEALQALQQAS